MKINSLLNYIMLLSLSNRLNCQQKHILFFLNMQYYLKQYYIKDHNISNIVYHRQKSNIYQEVRSKIVIYKHSNHLKYNTIQTLNLSMFVQSHLKHNSFDYQVRMIHHNLQTKVYRASLNLFNIKHCHLYLKCIVQFIQD